jgi:catechol-2,3-dioxygenase
MTLSKNFKSCWLGMAALFAAANRVLARTTPGLSCQPSIYHRPARGINPWKQIMDMKTAAETIGNVTLRVNDLRRMKQFYQDVLGFKLLGNLPSVALLRLGDDYRGPIQMFALLQRSIGVGPEGHVARHITFRLPVQDPESERRRLESLGLCVNTTNRETVGKCSLCFHDPEGNEVELLYPDPKPDRQRNPRFCKMTRDRVIRSSRAEIQASIEHRRLSV